MSKLTTKIRGWLDPIQAEFPQDLEVDQSISRAQWREAEIISGLKSFGQSVLMTGAPAFIGVMFWEPDQIKYVALFIIGELFIGYSFIVALVRNPSSKLDSQARLTLLGMVLGVSCAIAYAIYMCLSDENYSRSILVLAGFFWMSTIWGFGKVAAPLGKFIFLINCVLLIVPLAVFVTYSTSNRFGVVFFGVLITILISLFFWVLNKRDELYAILQTRATELETQNHIIRETAIRDDLKIARMYQDNLAQPAVEQIVGGNSVRILSRLPGRFRRDWVGIREISGDRYVMGIAVANESGVLGALAIQTAQSLWMASLQDVSWDPLKWMHSVHNVLRLMGMESPQTMNVGILVLDAHKPVYHVAGGLTLFASARLSTTPDIPHKFGGDSPPLGRSDLPEIKSHQIIMPGTKFDNFFLTNDEHSRGPGTEQANALAVHINTPSH